MVGRSILLALQVDLRMNALVSELDLLSLTRLGSRSRFFDLDLIWLIITSATSDKPPRGSD